MLSQKQVCEFSSPGIMSKTSNDSAEILNRVKLFNKIRIIEKVHKVMEHLRSMLCIVEGTLFILTLKRLKVIWYYLIRNAVQLIDRPFSQQVPRKDSQRTRTHSLYILDIDIPVLANGVHNLVQFVVTILIHYEHGAGHIHILERDWLVGARGRSVLSAELEKKLAIFARYCIWAYLHLLRLIDYKSLNELNILNNIL